MQLKKNAYTYVCYVLFAMFIIFTFTDYFGFFGEVGDIDWKNTAVLITVVLSAFVIVCLVCQLIARKKYKFIPVDSVEENCHISLKEKIIVISIISIAVTIRLLFVFNADASVFDILRSQNSYKMSVELANGIDAENGNFTLEFLSLFPSKSAYVLILGLIFKCFGSSGFSVMILNVVLSFFCILLTYLIARRFAGKIAGFIALVLSCFVPSRMLRCLEYSPSLLYEVVLLLIVFLFVRYFNKTKENDVSELKKALSMLFMGILTGILGFVSEFSCIFAICLFTVLLFKEWKQAIIYLVITVVSFQGISFALSQIYGYNMPIYIQEFGYDAMTNICNNDTDEYLTIDDALKAVKDGESPSSIQNKSMALSWNYLINEPENALQNIWNNLHLSNKDAIVYNNFVFDNIDSDYIRYASNIDTVIYVFTLFMSFIAIIFLYIFERSSIQMFLLYMTLGSLAAIYSGTINYEVFSLRNGLIIVTAYAIQKLYFNFVYGRIKSMEKEKNEQFSVNDKLQELAELTSSEAIPIQKDISVAEQNISDEDTYKSIADIEEQYNNITRASDYIDYYMPMTEVTLEPEAMSENDLEPMLENYSETEKESEQISENDSDSVSDINPDPMHVIEPEPVPEDEPNSINDNNLESLPEIVSESMSENELDPEPELLSKSELYVDSEKDDEQNFQSNVDEDFNIFDILPVSKRIISYEDGTNEKEYVIKKLDKNDKMNVDEDCSKSSWEKRRQRLLNRHISK